MPSNTIKSEVAERCKIVACEHIIYNNLFQKGKSAMSRKSLFVIGICLFLLVSLIASLLVFVSSKSQAANPPTLSWIKHQALPLQTTDPRAPLDDLQPLQPIVGSASIVGLGEATHGSHEFFTMKQRLLEFLVEKMGFTMFAMEAVGALGSRSTPMF